jgi:chromosome segregation ATPase
MNDITPLITAALDALGPNARRRERVFAVCEIWYRHHGVMPTIAVTRNHVGKGSYTDIGQDLRDYAATIVAKTDRAIAVDGMPDDLGKHINEIVNQLWVTTSERAAQAFDAERIDLQAQMAELEARNDAITKERLQAIEDRTTALSRLSDVEKQLSEEKTSVEAEKRNVSDLKASVSGLEAKIGAMETEKTRLQAEHAHDLASLNATLKERENRILDMQASAAVVKAGYEDRLSAASQLENEHRMRADRAESGRQKLQEVMEVTAAELANVRGQLVGTQERIAAIEASRDQAIGTAAVLERDLAAQVVRCQEVITDNTQLSEQVAMMGALIEEKTAALHTLTASNSAMVRNREG